MHHHLQCREDDSQGDPDTPVFEIFEIYLVPILEVNGFCGIAPMGPDLNEIGLRALPALETAPKY